MKNVPREKAKSTGISSLTLRKVTRWPPRSRAAISPKSSSGGSTTSAATTARACTGRRNGFTGGPFASNKTIARSFTSRVEALVACRASVAFNSRRSPYRSFPVADDEREKKSFVSFAEVVAEVVATSTSTETSPGSFGFKNAVTSTDFPGSTVANLGSTRNTSRSTRRSQLH